MIEMGVVEVVGVTAAVLSVVEVVLNGSVRLVVVGDDPEQALRNRGAAASNASGLRIRIPLTYR